MARGWRCLGALSNFRDRKLHKVDAFGSQIVTWQDSKGELNAIDNYCPHMGATLSDGRLEGDTIACPFHDWRWNGEGKPILHAFTRRLRIIKPALPIHASKQYRAPQRRLCTSRRRDAR